MNDVFLQLLNTCSHGLKENDQKATMEKVLLCITIISALCSASSLPAREFHFIYDLKTWTEAQSYCRELYTDLVTIQNLEDVTILKNKADLTKRVDPNTYLLWIGWYDDVNSWRWSMSDPNFYQHDETFRLWVPGEPNNYAGIGESCAKIRTTGQWGDFICSSTEYFICFNVNGENFTRLEPQPSRAPNFCVYFV
ncbi:C-type lectin domain family 10 member A-like [Nothobranchius furzeri]|uniref:C-type lectin domain family 10 member A-like n=1 Tax=Nothobranchius furzeri TaxID=105023 RepID=A0A9D2XY64_NOTFU|nr:C-type lectin domain family 10 member A-like [Nothobranchius furzeri]